MGIISDSDSTLISAITATIKFVNSTDISAIIILRILGFVTTTD